MKITKAIKKRASKFKSIGSTVFFLRKNQKF